MFNVSARPVAMRAALASIAVAITALAFATSASAVGVVSYTPSTGVLKLDGGAENSNVGVSFTGFSYRIEDTAELDVDAGSTSYCTENSATQVTCPAPPNAITMIWLNMGGGYDAVVGLDAPDYVVAKATSIGEINGAFSANPIEAYVSDDVSSGRPGGCGGWYVSGGSTHDYIEVTGRIPQDCDVETGDDSILGGLGDDQIIIKSSTGGSVATNGGEGDDLIDASESTRKIVYHSSPGSDTFIGGAGADEARFGDGEDLIYGNGGNDRIYDDGGDDSGKVWGGTGDDVFIVNNRTTPNFIHWEGGPGRDTLTQNNQCASCSTITITLDDNIANDGTPGDLDHVHPSVEDLGTDPLMNSYWGNDNLTGSDGRNRIWSLWGNDTVNGKGGADDLRGGFGNDTITGGAGNDTIFGDAGDDWINAVDGAGGDTIDCGAGTDDHVQIDAGDTVSNCETVS